MKGSDLWLMGDEQLRHLAKLTMASFARPVSARPSVPCTRAEVDKVLLELNVAVDDGSYIPETPTVDNPALSDDYIFTPEDKDYILKDLSHRNFVGKVKDVGKGAKKRLSRGLPQEYLYVFQYPCRLLRRDYEESGIRYDNVLIYIKVNCRTIHYKKVFIVSFHKNR